MHRLGVSLLFVRGFGGTNDIHRLYASLSQFCEEKNGEIFAEKWLY